MEQSSAPLLRESKIKIKKPGRCIPVGICCPWGRGIERTFDLARFVSAVVILRDRRPNDGGSSIIQ